MDSIFYCVLITIFGLILVNFGQKLCRYLKWRSMIMKIPSGGGSDHPIIGNLLDIIKFKPDSHEFYLMITKDFVGNKEGISRLNLFNQFVVHLYKAETVKAIMSNKILNKSDAYDFMLDYTGYSLITSTGDKWKKKRKILAPAFHTNVLEQFVEVFAENAQLLLAKIREYPEGSIVDIYPKCFLCVIDIIIETSLGRKIGAQEGNGHEFSKAITGLSGLFSERVFNPILWNKIFFRLSSNYKLMKESIDVIHNFTTETINRRKYARAKAKKLDEDVKKNGKEKKAFLDLLLDKQEEENDISDSDIENEVNTFFFAATDTTAKSIAFAIFLLGNHPEKQKLLHAELDNIFGDSDRPVTSQDIKEMNYLDCIIKETLRLYDVVPTVAKTIEEEIDIGKYAVPAGTIMQVFTRQLHRDPEVFPDPEEFRPERFLPENSEYRSPFAFLPFGGGPRNCIGQKFAMIEGKVILATIFRNLRTESVLKQTEMRVKLGVTICPENGKIEIKFFKRK